MFLFFAFILIWPHPNGFTVEIRAGLFTINKMRILFPLSRGRAIFRQFGLFFDDRIAFSNVNMDIRYWMLWSQFYSDWHLQRKIEFRSRERIQLVEWNFIVKSWKIARNWRSYVEIPNTWSWNEYRFRKNWKKWKVQPRLYANAKKIPIFNLFRQKKNAQKTERC